MLRAIKYKKMSNIHLEKKPSTYPSYEPTLRFLLSLSAAVTQQAPHKLAIRIWNYCEWQHA